jgi:hypothetical protein
MRINRWQLAAGLAVLAVVGLLAPTASADGQVPLGGGAGITVNDTPAHSPPSATTRPGNWWVSPPRRAVDRAPLSPHPEAAQLEVWWPPTTSCTTRSSSSTPPR